MFNKSITQLFQRPTKSENYNFMYWLNHSYNSKRTDFPECYETYFNFCQRSERKSEGEVLTFQPKSNKIAIGKHEITRWDSESNRNHTKSNINMVTQSEIKKKKKQFMAFQTKCIKRGILGFSGEWETPKIYQEWARQRRRSENRTVR